LPLEIHSVRLNLTVPLREHNCLEGRPRGGIERVKVLADVQSGGLVAMDLHRVLPHVLPIGSEVHPVLIGQLANAAQFIASQKMLPEDGERGDVVVHGCRQHAIARDDAAGQGQRGPIRVGAALAIKQVDPDLTGHRGPVNTRSANQFWRQ